MATYSAAATAAAKVETRTWVLQAETELRFDVSAEHTLTVVVSTSSVQQQLSVLRTPVYCCILVPRSYHAVLRITFHIITVLSPLLWVVDAALLYRFVVYSYDTAVCAAYAAGNEKLHSISYGT